ncbi:MAG: DUF362 domain-containing protein [Candidatus Kariarchaeaceae archaeon]
MSEVLLIQTVDRIDGIKRVIAHFKELISTFEGKKVVIKPNFNTADPAPASTDIVLVKELLKALKGVDKISIVERSGPANTHETMQTVGLFDLQNDVGGFDVVDLSQSDTEWVKISNEETKHWKDGFLFSKAILDAEEIIELPCLKTHQFGGHFTLSLKLATGLVPRDGYEYMKELHSSSDQRKMIAEINQPFKPSLIIMDGIDAFIDGGPAKGTLKNANIMLASTDRIAIDAVGVAILRMIGTTPEVENGSIFEQEQIARAVELNMGVKSASEIKIISDNSKSENYIHQVNEILNK